MADEPKAVEKVLIYNYSDRDYATWDEELKGVIEIPANGSAELSKTTAEMVLSIKSKQDKGRFGKKPPKVKDVEPEEDEEPTKAAGPSPIGTAKRSPLTK